MGNPAGGSAVSDRKKLHVAVLMGGWANERAVSLSSGTGVADALESKGHRVTRIDMGRDVAQRLAAAAPDVVFNALHGVPGEDGTVQGMLDLMGLAYTHSGLATSVIAIDKQLTKQALVPHGIPMPGGRIVTREELYERDPLPRPYVLKPVNEGSSVGVAIVTEGSNVGNPISSHAKGPWQEFAELLAEPFIKGRELTTAVIDGPDGPRALGVTELVIDNGSTITNTNTPPGRRSTFSPPSCRPKSPLCANITRCARIRYWAVTAPVAPISAGMTKRVRPGCLCSKPTPSRG